MSGAADWRLISDLDVLFVRVEKPPLEWHPLHNPYKRSIYEHKKESKSQRCKSVFNWYPSIRRSEHGNEQNPR